VRVASSAPPEQRRLKERLDQALVDSLSSRYTLVLFNYPGDPPKPHTLTPANVVADVLTIADAVEADRFAWCGYSWTAIIGLQLAINSDRLSGLICGGWPPILGPNQEMLHVLLEPTEPVPSWRSGADLQQIITFYRGLARFDDESVQDRITCPRLCFVGSADNIFDLGIARTIISPRANLERWGWNVRVLDRLDHLDALQSSIFVPIVADWLDQHLTL